MIIFYFSTPNFEVIVKLFNWLTDKVLNAAYNVAKYTKEENEIC